MSKKKHPEQGHYQSQIEEVEMIEEEENFEPDGIEEDEEDDGTPNSKRTRTKRQPRESKYKGQGRKITVAILKLTAGDSYALQFTGETRQQKIGNDDKPPALLYRVVDLDTGEMSDLIGSKVLVSTIDKNYPDGAVKDKRLLLECAQRKGKKYLDVLISELD